MVTINLSGLFLRLDGVLNFWKGILLLQISIILDPSTLLQHKSENAIQGKYPLHLPAGNMIALLLVLSSQKVLLLHFLEKMHIVLSFKIVFRSSTPHERRHYPDKLDPLTSSWKLVIT